MANVLVNNISVPRIARNKRIYGGNSSTSSQQIVTPETIPINKTIIPFGTDTPTIPDYSIYRDIYGEFPTIELFTYDESNNIIKRTEQPYFIMALGKVSSIVFGTFAEGSLIGFITIST